MKFDCVSASSNDPFMITWDLGRRCNYDCTYCAPIHHDNFSPHASLNELKKTADFIFEYITLVAKYRTTKDFHINLTGGEPTNNPNFLKLMDHLQSYKEKLKDVLSLYLTLTTNGTMGKRTADMVRDTFNFITVSYHTEADVSIKKNVLARIEQLHAKSIVKVNVMFHALYFDECVQVCEELKSKRINFIPRLIGENPGGEKDFGHQYTKEQAKWFNEYWNIEVPQENLLGKIISKIIPITSFGAGIGRPCCGGRKMKISNDTEEQEVNFLTYRKFKGWHCSVNWYFVHIEQQTDSVYHHQTCQAKFDGTTGAIGQISKGDQIISELKANLENNTMPIIVCPNTFCSCGLCTPKSSDKSKLLSSLNGVVDTRVFG